MALSDAEISLGAAFAKAPLLLIVLDADGRFAEVRGAWTELLGWSTSEILGMRPTELVHPDELAMVTSSLQAIYAGQTPPPHLELRIKKRDGDHRWICWFGMGLSFVEGRRVAIGIDISAERAARDAEHRARGQLRSILEAVPDYITQVDRDGIILFQNRTYAGTTVEQVIGTNLLNWIAPDYRETFAEAIRRVFAGSPAERVVVVGLGESGPTWYQSRIGPVIESGVVVGATIAGTDITQERMAELERRRRSHLETLGLFSAGIAHDFNNLVTVAQLSAEAAHAACAAGNLVVAQEAIQDILRSAARCGALTKHLLSFSRDEASSEPAIELSSALREARSLLVHLLGHNVNLSIDVPPSELWVRLSGVELLQIVANLASNTRRVIAGGGCVRCTVRPGTDANPILRSGNRPSAVLIFEDDGPGMEWKTQSKVFEPFFTSGDHGGTGIGLATVYAIVQRVAGDVTLKSAPGEGATFTFYFAGAEGRDEPLTPAANATTGGRETVLVVDDEPAIRSVAARYLSRLGFTTLEAANADDAEAVAKAHPRRIDLLLTDVQMPGRDGFQLARRMREQHPTVAVLFVTGYSARRDDPLLEGAPLLLKPFGLAELANKVREVLDARSVRREA